LVGFNNVLLNRVNYNIGSIKSSNITCRIGMVVFTAVGLRAGDVNYYSIHYKFNHVN